jgi:DNA-binding response OmpR family regulator
VETTLPRRLLVLDDDELVGILLENIARLAGYETRVTLNSEMFCSAAIEWRPDFIIMDLTLPLITGEEVLQILANKSCTAKLIICSGATPKRLFDATELARRYGLEVVGTLFKPFKPSTVRDILNAGNT